MQNFHLIVEIFVIFIFLTIFGPAKLEKMTKIEKIANFSTLVAQKSEKNHENSHTPMKIVHKMLLLTKNEPQWTIS